NPDYQFPVERWGTLRELWPEVTQRQNEGYSIYYFVNVVPPGPGAGKFGAATDDDVTTCRAFATDHDDGLPRAEKWHRSPSLIVHTSTVVKGGFEIEKGQALWLIADTPKDEWSAGQRQLIARYGADKAIHDPKRIFRLPGCYHRKWVGGKFSAPQLVTFEDRTGGLGRDCEIAAGDVLAGLPTAPERTDEHQSNPPEASSLEHLRHALTYINPYVSRPEWFSVIRAIKAAEIMGMDPIVADKVKRDLAHDFMAGRLYREYALAPTDAVHRTADEINRIFNEPVKEGGYTAGWIYKEAREAGWPEIPETMRAAVAEAIKNTSPEAPYGYSTLTRPSIAGEGLAGTRIPLGSDGLPRLPRHANGRIVRGDELLCYGPLVPRWSKDDDD